MAHIESQGSGGRASQDFELNLAPIIDCMVVLIAFLMVSLSYLSIQMIDAGLSSPGGLAAANTEAPSLELKIVSGSKVMVSLNKGSAVLKKSEHSVDELGVGLAAFLPAEVPSAQKPVMALINAENEVSYDLVIRAMDAAKSVVPRVQLSGF